MPIGDDKFQKTQRVFDSLNNAHDVIFKFTRLPAGIDADNKIQYSVSITVNGGSVKRFDAIGSVIDTADAPMIVTFNDKGRLNLFDYGQPTESDTPPSLHIEWTDPKITAAELNLILKLGKGKGKSPTSWVGTSERLAEGKLTSYNGNSLITYSSQDGLGIGSYEKVTVNPLGEISANYNNESSLSVGRLAFATVPNPAGLGWTGKGYRVTQSSGFPIVTTGGKFGWGSLDVKYPVSEEEPRYLMGRPVSTHALVGENIDLEVADNLTPVIDADQRTMDALRGMVDSIVSTDNYNT